MEGVSRASGKGAVEIKIPNCWESEENPNNGAEGFTSYWLPPMRVEEYAVVENHILKNRVSPIDAVLPEIERLISIGTKTARRMAKRLEASAYADLRKSKATNKLTVDEVQEYLDSVDGMLFTMKLCLMRNHPTITDAEVLRIFKWQGEEEARRVRDIAQGIDSMGNSTGPNPDAAVRAQAGASIGAGSSASSPKSTDGAPAT